MLNGSGDFARGFHLMTRARLESVRHVSQPNVVEVSPAIPGSSPSVPLYASLRAGQPMARHEFPSK